MASKITAEDLGFVDDRTVVPINSTAPSEPQEISSKTIEVQKLARDSLDFLAALCMPTIFMYCFPPMYHAIWSKLTSAANKTRDFSQIALGLPRGFCKTTFVKIFVIYCILFTKKEYILIICGTAEKAVNIVSSIFTMLSEKNIIQTFGDWSVGVTTDRQDLRVFGFRGRTIILKAAGVGSDIRGTNVQNKRPDVIVFDDIQSKEAAESEVQSEAIESWLYSTAMKTKSPHGCLFIFIANMYPTKWSILRKIKYNPGWIKIIVGGILANGKSLWEELQPLSQLLVEYQNDVSAGRPEVFHAEVLNDEHASVNKLLDTSKIPECPYEDPGLLHQGNFIIIDPSNDKANSDAVATGYFEVFEGLPVMKRVDSSSLSPGDSIKLAISWCLEKKCSLVAVESNAYQYSYLYWFNFICTQLGIQGIHCVELYSGSVSKNSRILSMFKSLVAKPEPGVYLAREVRAIVDNEIVGFNPLKTKNVDNVLDLITYASKCLEMYGEYIQTTLTIADQEYDAMEVKSAIETCCF